MKFLIHNKIVIKIADKKYEFYNQMLSSVYDKLESLDSYFDFLAFGTGNNENIDGNFKLGCHSSSYFLKIDSKNFNMKNGVLFLTKLATISDSTLDNKYITEAGITDTLENNPTVYNYFKLTSESLPNGIYKTKGDNIEILITIYLQLNNIGEGLFTAGENPFLKFLLGEGAGNKNFYAVRGHNFLDNKLIAREKPKSDKIYPCKLNFSKDESLKLSFSADMLSGETHEIVFLLNDEPFARINTEKINPLIDVTKTFSPKENYIIDIEKNATSIENILNKKTNTSEQNYFCLKYASNFGDKISLPFNNLFDAETPRFLSKDGDKIFFVLNDIIYAYQNIDYQIREINTYGLSIQNIFKIVSFDKFVFIFTKTEPYVFTYIIENESLIKANNNFSNYEKYNELGSVFDIDVTMSKDETFMLGYISQNYQGYVLYFNFNNTTKSFIFDSFKNSEYKFTYILAMYKNNFSDASIFFLKGGEFSYDCKIVTFMPNKTVEDIYTILCYYYTKDTKEISTKGRAVVVEKTTNPHLWIYFYPQMYRYNLELLGEELDDFLSTNMLYLIQKKSSNQYEIYNLVGYNTPNKFSDGFPKEIDQGKIESFEFLNDTLLIFLNDKENKICAYSLKEDGMLVENISDNTADYDVTYKKLNLIGSNNEGVSVTLTVNIKV